MESAGRCRPGPDPVPVKYLPWLAVCILVALGARQFFPRTVVVTEVSQLPGKTVFDTVEVSTIDSVIVERFRDRPVHTTIILRDTVWRTLPDTVNTLPFTWYLTRIQGGHSLDSPTYVSGEGLAYDGALTRVQTFEQYPVTLGPITDIVADSVGIQINFGTWPEPPKTCAFGCKAQIAVGFLAGGYLLGRIF